MCTVSYLNNFLAAVKHQPLVSGSSSENVDYPIKKKNLTSENLSL